LNDRKGGLVGAVALASLAVICCAGPLLVIGIASLGVGAWLTTHGLWLLGGLVLLLSAVALITYRRRQAAAGRVPDGEGSSRSQVPSKPREEEASS
jgi:membrane protein implicated in regulation of membrane protease activity